MRVSLFVTCFNDTLFPQTGRAVVRLLERLGCEVDFPLEQTCCGQMHMNSGYAREGAALARRFARVFGDAETVVTPSASCAGMLRHQLAGEDGPPVYELSELIVDRLGVEDVGAHFPHRVTFHPTCHSLRELGVGDRPLRLLRAVSGIELVELPQSNECCGFGGTFAVKNAEVSSAMLADKVRAVLDTGAEIVCAGDNSCLMHIDGALSRQRTGVRCMHLAEILGGMSGGFPKAASVTLRDSQLRRNLAKATGTIRAKRAAVVGEVPDWSELRLAGQAVKDAALASLDDQLARLEEAVAAAGGTVHWARDAGEANEIVCRIARSHGVDEVVKVKSIATDEIKLNEALAQVGVRAVETDLAELIIQLGDDVQSHILVPAIHKNRSEIRELFARELDLPDLTDEPAALAEAARVHLRAKFLSARLGISGANFAVAETGTVCVFESEGNGRMCTTLPEVLVTVMGIEKLVPSWRDMEVFLQLLPRSSTGERMNPYTSFWTGVRPGDGPQEFHLVLIDNGRTDVLADQVGRQALRCIRCSACLNVCPVYSRTGGHAYESVYPGPIGAILTPQLKGLEEGRTLPYASSLCGACYEVCPVAIDIPRVLVHLRGRVVDTEPSWKPEKVAMNAMFRAFSSRRAYERAQAAARVGARPLASKGRIAHLPWPLSGWSATRDLREPPKESFRDWWRRERGDRATTPVGARRKDAPLAWRPLPRGSEDARSTVLGRIRHALADRPAPVEIPRDYRQRSERSREEIVAVFAERVGEYRASVHSASADEVRDVVTRLCREQGAERMVAPDGLPAQWRPEGVELVDDDGLTARQLDELDGAVTGCALAIAETGVIVLDGGAGQGRRALTLVPDYHLCVVTTEQVVDLVTEAVDRLAPAVREGRPLTFVAGPSATSDIELNRVEGVHGPRTLHVVVV